MSSNNLFEKNYDLEIIATERLVPLKVLPGWVIHMNKFYDIDPVEVFSEGGKDRHYDHLFERYIFCAKCDSKEASIDLGWIPDYDPEGEFVLEINSYGSEVPIKEYRSRDKNRIIELLNRMLIIISIESKDSWKLRIKTLEC